MPRDVDFTRLRALPGRRVVSVSPGERVIAQGAPAAELFVVVSGNLRLDRDGTQVVEVGASELLGELGVAAGSRLPYSAIARTAATLIAIPAELALATIAQSPRFALGLAQTLADRAGQLVACHVGNESPAQSSRTTEPARANEAPPADDAFTMPSLLGVDLPKPPWEVVREEDQRAAAIDKSIPREEAFWRKTVRCPLCDTTFGALQVRENFVEVDGRDSDLHEHHRGINTMYYGVFVCPRCFYAALPDDFNRLTTPEQPAVRAALETVRSRVDKLDFDGFRDAGLARASFELAIVCYGGRRPQLRKVAGLYHRLAWIARAAGQSDQERAYLATARNGYKAVLEKGIVDDPRGELLLTYLVADLSRRLDDIGEASRWASMALQHPQLERHKMIAELAQQLRSDLRAARGSG